MEVKITFRHMNSVEALKEYAWEKFSKIRKYMEEPIEVSLVMSIEKHRHIAEVMIKGKGVNIKAQESTNDMHSSIDLLVDKVEKQLRRRKDRLVDLKHENIVTTFPKEFHQVPNLKIEFYTKEPMSLVEAIEKFEEKNEKFMMFIDSLSNEVCALIKGDDGELTLFRPQIQ